MTVKLKLQRNVQLLIRKYVCSHLETRKKERKYSQNVRIINQEKEADTGVPQRYHKKIDSTNIRKFLKVDAETGKFINRETCDTNCPKGFCFFPKIPN